MDVFLWLVFTSNLPGLFSEQSNYLAEGQT